VTIAFSAWCGKEGSVYHLYGATIRHNYALDQGSEIFRSEKFCCLGIFLEECVFLVQLRWRKWPKNHKMVFKNKEYDGIALYSCANYLYIHVV
jgi:hypothetical protein